MSLANPLLCDLPQKSRARWRLWNVDSVEDGDFPSHLLKKNKKYSWSEVLCALESCEGCLSPSLSPPTIVRDVKAKYEIPSCPDCIKSRGIFFFFPQVHKIWERVLKKKTLTAKSMGLNLSPSENHPNKITLSLKICHKLNWGTTTRACVFVKRRRCFMFPNL